MTFRFQIISDLHLEFFKHNKIPKIPKKAEYLFMAGDIGNYKKPNFETFLQYVSETFTKCFYVLGNHEYYGHDKEIADNNYQKILNKFDNIIQLNKDVGIITIENIDIIGCTLWSSPTFTYGLADFTQIKNGDRNLAVDDIIKYNKDDISFLRNCIENRTTTNKLLVMTHFMPVLAAHLNKTKYKNSKYDFYFGNYLVDLVKQTDLWIFGHTHETCNQMIGNCKLLSNPLGYPDEQIKFTNDVYTLEN